MVPGLYAVAKLYLTIPVVMADGAGSVEALSVSALATDGHVWTVFGYTVLVGVLSGGVSIPLQLAVGMPVLILSVVSLCATGGQIVHKNFSLTV